MKLDKRVYTALEGDDIEKIEIANKRAEIENKTVNTKVYQIKDYNHLKHENPEIDSKKDPVLALLNDIKLVISENNLDQIQNSTIRKLIGEVIGLTTITLKDINSEIEKKEKLQKICKALYELERKCLVNGEETYASKQIASVIRMFNNAK